VLLLHLDYLSESIVTLGCMGDYPERLLRFASAESITVCCEKSFFGRFYTPGFSPRHVISSFSRRRRLPIRHRKMFERYEVDCLANQMDHFGVYPVTLQRSIFGCSNGRALLFTTLRCCSSESMLKFADEFPGYLKA